MNLAFLVNDPQRIEADSTTASLAAAALVMGHTVEIVGVRSLSLDDGDRVWGMSRRLSRRLRTGAQVSKALPTLDPARLPLDELDSLAMRTSPGRDANATWAHETAMRWCGKLQERGVFVFNDPDGLRRAGGKDYLASLPADTRPRMLISRDRDELVSFIESCPTGAVLKPLSGTRGQGVFRIRRAKPDNMLQIIETVTELGYAVAQPFVPEGKNGDTRVLVLDGRPLRVEGHTAAVWRTPGPKDFRSNVHAGGVAKPAVIRPKAARVLAKVAPLLARDGIFFAGIDLVGDQVVEVNVFATGGIPDAERFCGVPFAPTVVEAIEARVAALQAPPLEDQPPLPH